MVRAVRVGDVVEVEGYLENVGDEGSEADAWKKGLRATSGFRVVDEWNEKLLGKLQYEVGASSLRERVPTYPSRVAGGVGAKLPALVLQCQAPFVARVGEYIQSAYGVSWAESATHLSSTSERHVLVFAGEGELSQRQVLDDQVLHGALMRVYSVASESVIHRGVFLTAQNVCTWLNSLKCLDGRSVRLQVFPKGLLSQVLDCFELSGQSPFVLLPKGFDFVASVILCDGVLFCSVARSESSFVADIYETFRKGLDTVCRAQYKLKEAFVRAGWPPLLSRGVALDIGASPGGWSTFLGEDMKCRRVIACDPGKVDVSTPGVEHWQMPGQEAIEALLKTHVSDATDAGVCLDYYVTDANVPPPQALDMLRQAQPLFVPGHTRIVVTLKNVYRSKEQWLRAKQELLPGFEEILHPLREVHLIANKPSETTLFGVFRAVI